MHICAERTRTKMLYKFNVEIINNDTVSINADSLEDATKKIGIFKKKDKFYDCQISKQDSIDTESNYFTYRLLGADIPETVKKNVYARIHFDTDAYKTFYVDVAKNEQDDIDYEELLSDEISNTEIDDSDVDVQWSDVSISEICSVEDCKEDEEELVN